MDVLTRLLGVILGALCKMKSSSAFSFSDPFVASPLQHWVPLSISFQTFSAERVGAPSQTETDVTEVKIEAPQQLSNCFSQAHIAPWSYCLGGGVLFVTYPAHWVVCIKVEAVCLGVCFSIKGMYLENLSIIILTKH